MNDGHFFSISRKFVASEQNWLIHSLVSIIPYLPANSRLDFVHFQFYFMFNEMHDDRICRFGCYRMGVRLKISMRFDRFFLLIFFWFCCFFNFPVFSYAFYLNFFRIPPDIGHFTAQESLFCSASKGKKSEYFVNFYRCKKCAHKTAGSR